MELFNSGASYNKETRGKHQPTIWARKWQHGHAQYEKYEKHDCIIRKKSCSK